MQRLTRATDVVAAMQSKIQSQRVLQSAEAAAIYSLMTGTPNGDSYDLSPDSPIDMGFGLMSADGSKLLTPSDVSGLTPDLWPATGGMRRYSLPNTDENAAPQQSARANIYISLQDTTGLASLNQVNSKMLTPILQHVGANGAEARQLSETLQDYIDLDSDKRSSGAENGEYRRAKKPPPTNSPLRSFEELGAIMHWDEKIGTLDMTTLKELTTLTLQSGFRPHFASPLQNELFSEDAQSLLQSNRRGLVENIELNNTRASDSARLRIWARRPDGRYDKRVIEIERTLTNLESPYRRRWVYDATVLESDLEKSASTSLDENEPIKLDGLKHVVHAASSAP